VIGTVRETGNQLHLRAGFGNEGCIDSVGNGRHQDVRRPDGLDQFFARARRVIDVQLGFEQLAHARFHGIGQFPRDIDLGSFPVRHGPHQCLLQNSLTKSRDTRYSGRQFLPNPSAKTNKTRRIVTDLSGTRLSRHGSVRKYFISRA
jgi:hypothetical protein